MSTHGPDAPGGEPGRYERYRQQIDDPTTRDALLLQVRGTVQGLRSAYALHLLGAILAIAAILVLSPGGFLATWRAPLIAGLLLVDLTALGGFRSVTTHPRRWILPLVVLDLVIVLGLTGLSAAHGTFSLAWLLLLLFPVMLVVNHRDARDIAALLAEHAAWRHRNAGL